MSKRKILKYGSEILRRVSSPVTKFDKRLKKIIDDMLDTMYASHGVGLAAPQVGINQRIVVIDAEYGSDRYDEEGNATGRKNLRNPLILINPEITHMEGELESFEGCLSFPDVYFNVTRANKINFKFYDLKGKEVEMEAEGDLFCRCVQHELDHLNGQLFVDIANDKIVARDELDKHGFANVDSQPLA